jgi:phosphatidylserine/phosphatidylglycerophosphate/cardiolipin synthase-like enzyme
MRFLLLSLVFVASLAAAQVPAPMPAKGTVQVAFPPWDDAEGMIVEVIRASRSQILVQAYSFTSRNIANALIAARRRGLDVRVVADREQAATSEAGRLDELSAAGIPVLLDANFQSAHSKVMVVDARSAQPAVVTGSYNWTYAAQYRNAENVIVLRGHPELTRAYLANWERHAASAIAYERKTLPQSPASR